MKRNFRLTSAIDFKRVRHSGKPFAHPFVVLIALPNASAATRIGISAGKSVGNAVQRNRAKRQLRAAVQPLIPGMQAGWDIVFLARSRITNAPYQDIAKAVKELLIRAQILPTETNVY